MTHEHAKKIVFVFLVLTLISSLSAVAFITGNLAFATKKDDGGGSSDKGGGSSGSSGDNGGGGGSSSDNGGGGSSDTGSTTTTPPPTTDETTQAPPPTTEESTPPPEANQQTTCPDGSTPDPATGNCPTSPDNSGGTATTPPPAAADQTTCPDGSTPDATTGNCPPAATQQNVAPHTLTQQTCPPLPIDENGRCPGVDMRGGGLGLPPPPPQPKPIGDGSFQLPTVPPVPNTGTIAPICPEKSHLVGSKCVVDGASCPGGTDQDGDICKPQVKTTTTPAGGGGTTNTPQPKPIGDGSFQLPTVPPDPRSGGDILLCPSGSHVAQSKCVVNGASCPDGTDQAGDICKPQVKTTTTPASSSGGGGGTTAPPAGGGGTPTTPASTPTGTTGGATGTPTGSTTTTTTPEPPAELEVPVKPGTVATCPDGTRSVGSAGNAGQPGTGSIHCLAQKTPDGSFILPSVPQSQGSNCNSGYVSVGGTTCVLDISCPQGTTKIGATQCIVNKLLPAATTTALPAQKPSTTTVPGGPTTTTTTTGNPTTPTPATSPTTTTKPPTSTTAATTTTTNVINKGGSSTAGGGNAAAPAQGANTFLTYVNAVNKLTIKYPSTWTKTDLVGNPSIPVMFSAPTAIIAAAGNTPATKTSFVISITPSASNLDSFTRQQINTLTNSKAVIYTITDTNAKVLTPPTGITAFREVSYDAMKNGVSGGNNIPTQVPLKGAAIFFVNGGTGYSLLYLAKQTEYTQNLPMVQQMVNSFQIGAPGGGAGVQNVAAASGAR